jgi:ABC-type multidrug transport system fused ATPase/permease subunit
MRQVQKARVYTVDLQHRLNLIRPYVEAGEEAATIGATVAAENGVDIQSMIAGGDNFMVLLSFSWELLGKLDGRLVEMIADRVLGAGIVACIVGFALIVVSWVVVLKTYKADMLKLRYGDDTRFHNDTNVLKDYAYAEAAPLPGLVIWRSVLIFIAVFFPIFIVLFIISWDWFWLFLIDKILGFTIGVVGLSIVESGAMSLAKKYTVKENWFPHRRIYAIYEFAVLFIGFASGIVSAISQLIASMTAQFAAFPRIDKRSYAKDPAFEAYAAMLREDHEWNSPCVQFAIDTLKTSLPKPSGGVKDPKSTADPEKGSTVEVAAKDTQALMKLHILYTLLNNEDLSSATHRKGDRPGMEAAVHGRASQHGKDIEAEKKEKKEAAIELSKL